MAHWWTRLRRRNWRTAQDDRDLDDEIRFHFAAEEQMRVETGSDATHARVSARRDFGNVLRVKEVTREVSGRTWIDTFVQDLTFGFRVLRRNRLFAIFSITSLALGIGATSAIFSLFNAIVLRELPVHDPDRLISLSFAMGANSSNTFMPYPHFAAMRDRNTTLDGLFAWTGRPRLNLGVAGRNEIVSAMLASGGYHSTLGLAPAAGRLLTPDDDQPGAGTAVVISYGLWQRRFGGNPSIVGAEISLNQVPFTIVGVEPRGFSGVNVGYSFDVTLPLRARDRFAAPSRIWSDAFATWIEIMGRVRPGVAIEQARQELTLIFAQVNADEAAASPNDAFAGRVAREARLFVNDGARGGQSILRHGYERWLRLLLMMLAAVVLLASLNVATLLLSRAEARRSEIATRLAIGAGRARIVRQLLTESLLIAATGGVLGLLFAWWASGSLLRIALRNLDVLPIDLAPNARVVAFTMLVSGASCLLFGLMPALRATARQGDTREIGQRRRRYLERTLVGLQTALSLVLLVFAALFGRSLGQLWNIDPGYDRTNVAVFSLDASLVGKKGDEAAGLYKAVVEALKTRPAAQSVTASSVAPVSNSYYFISGVSKAGGNEFDGDRRIRVAVNNTAPGYFSTMRIPLLLGRDFADGDTPGAPKVAIVSETLARKFTGTPVGQLVVTSDGTYEVVGVARDNRYASIKDLPRDVVYTPIFQAAAINYSPTFEIRFAGPASDMLRQAREAVAQVHSGLTLLQLNTLEGYTRDSLSRERLLSVLSAYLGGFALLLASIGLYGLLSYTVTERTPEIGLRMALGSRPSGIARLVVRDSAITVIAGMALGLAAAWMAVRLVQTQLFGVEPRDPMAMMIATLTLLAVAAMASYLPARRAARIDPIGALRRE